MTLLFHEIVSTDQIWSRTMDRVRYGHKDSTVVVYVTSNLKLTQVRPIFSVSDPVSCEDLLRGSHLGSQGRYKRFVDFLSFVLVPRDVLGNKSTEM